MRLISRRGNTFGKQLENENTTGYIQHAYSLGFDVEVDFRLINGEWWLGHDKPEYKVDERWILENKKYLWCHAKNIDAMYRLITFGTVEAFYHQTDDVTLTTGKYLWTYPGKRPLTNISIAVMPETADWNMKEFSECAGICSDYIAGFKVEE